MGCAVTKSKQIEKSVVISIQESDLQQKEYPQTPDTSDQASPRNQNIQILKKLLASSSMSVDELVKPISYKKSPQTSLSKSRRQ